MCVCVCVCVCARVCVCMCVCVCVCVEGWSSGLLVYPHRSKPRIMDLIKETHVRVQCIPMCQPFGGDN